MAKATAQANSEGKSLDVHMAELAKQIEAGIVSAELLTDPTVKQRLGDRYPRVMGHVRRVLSYYMTTVEQTTKQKFPNREKVEDFFSQYP